MSFTIHIIYHKNIRVDSDDEGPSMIEVLPPAPCPPGPVSLSCPVPRFAQVQKSKEERPVCPLCPKKFIVSSRYSVCTICDEQYHNG